MSRSLRRGALAATALALSAAVLTACGAGNQAETLQVRPDNAATSVGDIKIQAVTIVVAAETGPSPAAVTARIYNTGDKAETLEAIRFPGTDARVKLSPAKGETLEVPAFGHLAIGGKGNASAAIAEAGEGLSSGAAVPIVFELSETGRVKLRATVMPADHDLFGKFGPSARPTAPGDASPKPGESTPAGEPTGSPTGSPTGTASPTEGAQGGEDADAHEAGDDAADDDAGGTDDAGESAH